MAVTRHGVVPVLCSKLGAIDRLTKLCGWNEPEKHEHDGRVIIEVRKL
jgi:hypothetical protein